MAQAENNRRSDERRFVDVSTEPNKILPPLPQYSESEPIPTLIDAIKSSEHLVEDLRKKAEEALSKCKNSKHDLTRDQSAALYLYSMQWPKGKNSFYFMFNRALRSEDRTKLIPFHSYFKLFMSALSKLPSKEQQVWRGVVGDLTSQYLEGATHVWWGASSCTDKVNVTGMFLDQKEKRTLFNIKCYEGKVIKDYSEFPNESETILPPGTYLTVASSLLMSSDVYLVQLEQVPPDPKLIVNATSVAYGASKKNDKTLCLIWSDPTVNKSSENKKTQEKLRNIFDNNFKSFESGDQCENFINQNKNYRLILIVSGQIGRDLVPKIHNLSQITSIYVYCMNKQENEKWTKNYNKVKDIVVESSDLIETIEKEKEKIQQVSTTKSSGVSYEPKILCPFKGYENEPLLPLEETLQPLCDKIPQLKELMFVAKRNSKSGSKYFNDGLTWDESAAIHIYTMEAAAHEYSLYRLLNADLRSEDRHCLKKWFPYLKLFLSALDKLPSYQGTVWRGVNFDIIKDYPKGKRMIWWGVSSAAPDLSVLDSYINKTGIRTLFSIECQNGKEIGHHSCFPNEKEILLMPGFCFEVMNALSPAEGLHIINVKEIETFY